MLTESGDLYPLLRGDRAECDLELETALDLLSATIRQKILRFLASTPEDTVAVESLYEYLRNEVELPQEEIAIRCHHIHLPKLQQAGVIEYDSRTGAIRYHRHITIEQLLDDLNDIPS